MKTPILKKDLETLKNLWKSYSSDNSRNPFDEVYEHVIANEDHKTLRRGETTEFIPLEFDFHNKTVKEIRDYLFENFDDDTIIYLEPKTEEDLECEFEDELLRPFDKYSTIVTRKETQQEYIDRLYTIFYKHNESLTLRNILHKEQIQRKEEIEKQMASLQSELELINKTLI